MDMNELLMLYLKTNKFNLDAKYKD